MDDAPSELSAEESEALQNLAGEPYDPPVGHRPCFRLWHYPIGEDWRSWTLFLGPEEDGLVRETGWNRRENSLWTTEAPLSGPVIAGVRRRAGRLGFLPQLGARPAWAEFGIEGHTGAATPDATIYWTGTVPSEFRGIAAWFSRTRALFEEKIR